MTALISIAGLLVDKTLGYLKFRSRKHRIGQLNYYLANSSSHMCGISMVSMVMIEFKVESMVG